MTIPERRILSLRGKHDRPGRKDVTFAFAPEAEKFSAAVGGGQHLLYVVDNKKAFARRRADVLEALEEVAQAPNLPFDTVAFFCHGWRNGMELGFTRANASLLAAALWKFCTVDVVVPLYLCSTGAGQNHGAVSFADSLRDELCKVGAVDCRVMAHQTVAHTTKNPHALFFDGMGSPVGGVGGYPVVGRRTQLWGSWTRRLRSSDLRFRFPFMEVGEIHSELLAT